MRTQAVGAAVLPSRSRYGPALPRHCTAVCSAAPGLSWADIWVQGVLRGIFRANGQDSAGLAVRGTPDLSGVTDGRSSSTSPAVPGERQGWAGAKPGDHKTPEHLSSSSGHSGRCWFHTLICNTTASVFTKRNLKCINRALVCESSLQSPCLSFASSEIWACIQLGISQMTPRSERGLHKNLKSKYSQFCKHSCLCAHLRGMLQSVWNSNTDL